LTAIRPLKAATTLNSGLVGLMNFAMSFLPALASVKTNLMGGDVSCVVVSSQVQGFAKIAGT
jgi:hypothetical protein